MYRSGLIVLADPNNPDRFSLCAHAIREMMEKLHEFLNVSVQAQRESLKPKVQDLANIWSAIPKNPVPSETQQSDGKVNRRIEVFLRKASEFFEWFSKHHPTRRKEIRGALARLDGSGRSLPAPLAERNIQAWEDLRDFFVNVAHHRRDTTFEEISRWLDELERFLLVPLLPKTFEDFAEIDALLKEEANAEPERVKKMIELIQKRGANHDYFFSKLDSPDWILPLQAEGLFKAPPSAQREGDTISFEIWPESKYLARIASVAPQQVLDVIERIPPTDNIRIHTDFSDAAIRMPAGLSARWVRKEIEWIKEQDHLYFLLPEKLGELCEHLATNGEVDIALRLAGTLLAITYLPERHAVRARFNDWNYEQILKKNGPAICHATGLRAIKLFCDLLAESLSHNEKGREPEDDYSRLWRPAIEPTPRDHSYGDLRSVLVDAIRDGSVSLIEIGQCSVQEILDVFDQHKRMVFRRLALHFLAAFRDRATDLAKKWSLNPEFFENHHFYREHSHLLRAVFPSLDVREQDEVLVGTQAGSVASRVDLDPEEKKRLEDYRMLWRLWVLRDLLTEEWQSRLQTLLAEHGPPTDLDFEVHTTTLSGLPSPKSKDELKAMEPEAIANFLRTWVVPTGWDASQAQGLARDLQNLVKEDAQRFVSRLDVFVGIDPTYANAIINALRELAESGVAFDWSHVIEFAGWIVSQPREIEGRKANDFGLDPHWGWTRKAVATLLGIGFDKDAVPHQLRSNAWEVLRPLTDDPDPSPEDDAQSSMDAANRAINSVRGEALNSAVKYALWVHRQAGKEGETATARKPNFDTMPEVKEVLERHLDIRIDPSLAVRSVYGESFPWFVLMDLEWAESHKSSVFPTEPEQSMFLDAAWTAYILYRGAYNVVFDILEDTYRIAVERIAQEHSKEERIADRNKRLGEHLMLFVGQGKLTFEDAGGMCRRFFELADDKLAAHAVGYVGRCVENRNIEVPAAVMQRFQIFWDRLLANLRTTPAQHRKTLQSFGWWFSSGKFPDDWGMANLQEVLNLTGYVDADDFVMERLAGMASDDPARALNVLRKLVRGDEGWGVTSWGGLAEKVLRAALQDARTATEAKTVIHELGARGHFQFRELSADSTKSSK